MLIMSSGLPTVRIVVGPLLRERARFGRFELHEIAVDVLPSACADALPPARPPSCSSETCTSTVDAPYDNFAAACVYTNASYRDTHRLDVGEIVALVVLMLM